MAEHETDPAVTANPAQSSEQPSERPSEQTSAQTFAEGGVGGSGRRRVRRQQRVVGGRQRPVHVRVSEEEFVQLSARAAAAGLSVPAWLVAAGMADRGARAAGKPGAAGEPGEAGGRSLGGGSMGALERRAWAAEFVAVRRLARGVATNVNQLAAGYNATGAVAPEAGVVLDAARRVLDRMDALGALLSGGGSAAGERAVVDDSQDERHDQVERAAQVEGSVGGVRG